MSNRINPVTKIQDGTPLTYDKINEMIDTINKLINRKTTTITRNITNNNSSQDSSNDFSYVHQVDPGSDRNSVESVRILTRSVRVNENKIDEEISIDYSGFSVIPKIFVSVRDANNKNKELIHVSVTTTKITKNSASFSLKKAGKQVEPLILDLLIIGPK